MQSCEFGTPNKLGLVFNFDCMKRFFSDSEDDELSELIQAYEQIKQGYSSTRIDEEDFEKLIEYYDDMDNTKEAYRVVEVGLKQHPFSAQLMIKKADLLISLGNFTLALEELETAKIYDAGDYDIYVLTVECYIALRQETKAVEIFEQAINSLHGEDLVNYLLEVSDVFDDYEDFEKVFDCYKLLLQTDPSNEEALYKICFWTDFTGRFEESIQLHNQIIDQTPYNEIAWFNLAAAYQGLKLHEKAVDAYQYAIAIDEKFEYAYRNLGDAYLRLKKYKDAIEALEKALELSPPEDVIFEAIGHCHHKLKNFQQARSYYKKAAHLNPNDAKIQFKIATTFMAESQWNSAINYLENALTLYPNYADFNLAIGECKMQLGDYKMAANYFIKIIQNKPKNFQAREQLIKCLLLAHFNQGALEACQKSIPLFPKKPILNYYLSICLYNNGHTKKALEIFEDALVKNGSLLKKITTFSPDIVSNPQFADIIARHKKGKRKNK